MGSPWIKAANPLTPIEYAATMTMILPIVEAQRGRVTMGEIIENHQQEKCDLWYTVDDDAIQSMAIVRVKEYRSGLRILHVEFGAGQMTDFYDRMGEAEDLARANSCERLQISGRPGWLRALRERGDMEWEEVSRVIEKEVGNNG